MCRIVQTKEKHIFSYHCENAYVLKMTGKDFANKKTDEEEYEIFMCECTSLLVVELIA